MIKAFTYAAALALSGGSAQALTLAECDRTTHISHGGESAHMDLGDGRVMWRGWWSQEGTATDLYVSDCAPGDVLSARVAEDRMGKRSTFDRTEKALKAIDQIEAGARVFATLDRMAMALVPIARDVTVARVSEETWACAAAYPDLRGTKTEFDPESGQ